MSHHYPLFSPKFFLSPLVGLIDNARKNEPTELNIKKYGSCCSSSIDNDVYPKDRTIAPSHKTNRTVTTFVALAFFITWIAGMAKAFQCGSATSSVLGGSGTLWGFSILIFGILVGPIGILLSLVFLASGGCQQAPFWVVSN